MNEDRIYIGGLMRCDIETIRERTTPGVEGEIQQCKYSDDPWHRAVFQDSARRWFQPRGDDKETAA